MELDKINLTSESSCAYKENLCHKIITYLFIQLLSTPALLITLRKGDRAQSIAANNQSLRGNTGGEKGSD